MNLFNDPPAGAILFIYAVVRAWSFMFTMKMLNVILRSGTGKRSAAYKKHATLFQRIYGTYIPKVTRYCHKLSRYLACNNLLSAILSALFIILWALNNVLPQTTRGVLWCVLIAAAIILCAPPIIVSYANTSYNGGHPHYRFDLESDFIGPKAQLRKKALLDEKRNSVIITPEELARKNTKGDPR